MSIPQACIKYHSERHEMGFIRHLSLRHYNVPAALLTNPVRESFFFFLTISQLTDAAEKSALEACGMKATVVPRRENFILFYFISFYTFHTCC